MVMRESGTCLENVLGKICMPYRPETIVLGGAIGRSSDPVSNLGRRCAAGVAQILRRSQLLDEAAFMGAAVRCSEAPLSKRDQRKEGRSSIGSDG
jgi:hypothetical protein